MRFISLLVTTDEMYTKYLHGIQEILVDKDLSSGTVSNWHFLSKETRESIEMNGGLLKRRTKRISLTFRDVKKVRNLSRFLQTK
jgi:alkylated DNA repair protein alkB family protein 6